MSKPIRKIFSDSIIYGLGNAFNRFLGFLLLPIYTFYFSPAEFGIYSLVYALWFFLVVFYLFGLETAFQKYFLEAKTHDEKKRIFSTVLFIIITSSILLSVIVFLASDYISEVLTRGNGNPLLIKLLAVLLVIDCISRFPMILINSLQKSKIYTLFNTFGVLINISLNVVLIIAFKMGIEAILYSYLASYTFIIILSMISCRGYFSFSFDKSIAKILLKYGHQFLYYGLFLISLDLIDRFILGQMEGDNEVGIYSACYRIGLVMNLAISGFRNAWIPFFMNMKEQENNKEIFSKVFTYFCASGLFIFLIVSLFGNEFVSIKIGQFSFINERYREGMVILPLILLSYFFFGLYTNLLVGSFLENKIKYLLISSGAACLSNIILNLILIPSYSYVGAAIATMVSYGLMFVILYYYSQKIYHIKYEWGKIFVVFALTAILYFAFILFGKYFESSQFQLIGFKAFLLFILIMALYKYLYVNRGDSG